LSVIDGQMALLNVLRQLLSILYYSLQRSFEKISSYKVLPEHPELT